MANSDPHFLESSIRRIRSAGDIPRRPEPALIHPNIRPSESALDHRDQHISASMQGNSYNSSSSRTDGAPSSAPAAPISDSSSSWPNHGPSVTSGTPSLPQGQTAQGIRTTNHSDAPNHPPASARSTSLIGRLLTYFGLGRRASHARKALVSLIWGICWDITQIVVIITMLILTGVHFRSTKDPSLSEWKACDRPLGIWASIWIIRVVLASILGYWEYRRNRVLHLTRSDAETSNNRAQQPVDATPHNAQGNGGAAPLDNGTSPAGPAQEPPVPPHSVLYSRLTLLSSLLTLSWFLTAHILEYTSINTCRHTSPHLWWLVFAILCTMYLMVLEVVLLGFVVLIVAPILFIFWNVFLICIGRHPLQNPNMIKPEIGKLPKAVVERIPLVMYIPPPPQNEKDVITQPPHAYPPKTPTSNKLPERRFKLLRNFTPFGSKKFQGEGTNVNEKLAETLGNIQTPSSWEDGWEQSEYPFVALEGNRAACAICLMDFEEPKRKNPVTDNNGLEQSQKQEGTTTLDPQISGSPAPLSQGSNITEEHRQDQLKLEDAGDGAQPLRLLECGHVFHKTCLDPWLTDVSGRCPVCQRPVEAPKQRKKFRRPT